jgi:excisionase family DNA binding protein
MSRFNKEGKEMIPFMFYIELEIADKIKAQSVLQNSSQSVVVRDAIDWYFSEDNKDTLELKIAEFELSKLAVKTGIMQQPNKPLMIGLTQATKMIGLSRSALYKLLSSNEIRSVKIGRRRLIDLDSLERWSYNA